MKPAFALIAAGAVVVALWAMRSTGVDEEDGAYRGQEQAIPAPAIEPLTLNEEGPGRMRSTANAAPSRWTVRVRREDGGSVEEALITARHLSEVLEGRGANVAWEDLQPGDWSIVATLGDLKVRRTVTLLPGQETLTTLVLGEPARLLGTVTDVAGAGLGLHFIGLVPAGDPMPATAKDWLRLQNGRSNPAGQFDFEVETVGSYQVFVGYGGDILVASAETLDLEPGETRRLSAVIPPPVTLLLQIAEPGGELKPMPYMASVYRRKEIMDAERPVPPMPKPTVPDLDSMNPEERAEAELAIERQKKVVDPEELARRRAVAPKGFRVDRSATFDAGGRLLLVGLPVGEELRFALRRGREVFRVEGSAVLNPDLPTLVELILPAESTDPDPVVQAVTRLTDGVPRRLDPGIRWE